MNVRGAGADVRQVRCPVLRLVRPPWGLCLLLLFSFALCCTAQDVRLQRRPTGALPPELVRARDRMWLQQPSLQPFHLELAFESTSEITGEVIKGTLTEDWWSAQWWRQVFTVNGHRSERVQVEGRLFQEDDPAFVMPLHARRLFAAFWHPFPRQEEAADSVQDITLAQVALHCMTLPHADEEPDMRPAPRTYCVDVHEDLRATTGPNSRVIYNHVEAAGSRRMARQITFGNKTERLGELRVTEWRPLTGGQESLQKLDMEDQVRLALAKPRVVIRCSPAWMQAQMISLDVRMVPQSTLKLMPGQRYAIAHILEDGGRLLDAEIAVASDEAAKKMALRILQQTSFRQNSRLPAGALLEGTVLLAVPAGR